MSEIVVVMAAVLAGELLLALLVLLAVAWFRERAARRRDSKAIRVLVTRIKNTKMERETTIGRFLGEQMGLSGEPLEQAKTAMLRAELVLLQRFAGIYKNRDAGAAAQFDIDLVAALAPYQELQGDGVVVTTEETAVDTSELTSLQAENIRLEDELRVTMETMSRMLNEYSTMFAGAAPGEAAPIAALVGGVGEAVLVAGDDAESTMDSGQTVPSSDADAAVESAIEPDIEVAAEVEIDGDVDVEADPVVIAAEDDGDAGDIDVTAQDDIDELFAAEGGAGLFDAPGRDEVVDRAAVAGGEVEEMNEEPGAPDDPPGDGPPGVAEDYAAPAVEIEAGDDLETVAELLEGEGPAEVVAFDESDEFDVELAVADDGLFDSAESEIVVRAEAAAGDLLDDAETLGDPGVDELFDAVDGPPKTQSGN